MHETLISIGWTLLLRPLEAVIAASPSFLLGLLLAAILRSLFSATAVRRFFDSKALIDLIPACILLTVIPICSFGVLPILHELRRVGVSRRMVIIYGLAAPVFNLWSLIFGLSRMPLGYWLFLVLGSAGIVIVVGFVWSWRDGPPPANSPFESTRPAASPFHRLLDIARNAGLLLTGRLLCDVLVGLLGISLFAAAFRPEYAADVIAERHVYTLPLLTALMLPAFVDPETAMTQANVVYKIGTVPSAGLLALLLGSGVNLGFFWFARRAYGWRSSLKLFLILVGVTLAVAWSVDHFLSRTNFDDQDNDAFNQLSRDARLREGGTAGFTVFRHVVVSGIEGSNSISLAALGLIVIAGIAARTARFRAVPAIQAGNVVAGAPSYWRPIPPWGIRLISLGVLAALATVATYTYFPDPQECFNAMSSIDTELYSIIVTHGSAKAAEDHIDSLSVLAHKLEWGETLRFKNSAEKRSSIHAYLERLADLHSAINVHDDVTSNRRMTALSQSLEDCKRAFGREYQVD
jgi:uncharacterized membrane protein YraQ (UPF0718 family)